MKRKAIIIESSNVKGETDLPGARVDKQNWVNFLISDLGGAWGDGEIITLSKPTSSVLEGHLDDHRDKYCFVAFSGHGCDGSIALNDSLLSYPISKLKPRGRKGTVVVDSCRGVEKAALRTFSAHRILLEHSDSGRAVVANSQRGVATKYASGATRELIINVNSLTWFQSLETAGTGIVEMLACAKGEAAGENPNSGGYYTSLLLQSADLWQQRGGVGNVHSTRDAHDHAAQKLPAQQTPEYKPNGVAFPFAVSV